MKKIMLFVLVAMSMVCVSSFAASTKMQLFSSAPVTANTTVVQHCYVMSKAAMNAIWDVADFDASSIDRSQVDFQLEYDDQLRGSLMLFDKVEAFCSVFPVDFSRLKFVLSNKDGSGEVMESVEPKTVNASQFADMIKKK